MLQLLSIGLTALLMLTASQDMDPTVVELADVPVAVLQELLKLTDDEIVDGELERGSRKIYRARGRDVAYYEFKFNGQYVILANAARGHVDNILVSRGPLPSPTESVTLTASERLVSCSRYILLAPEGPLGCAGSDGRIVAGSDEWKSGLAEAGVLRKLQDGKGQIDWKGARALSDRRFRYLWKAYERSVSTNTDVRQFLQMRQSSSVRPSSYIEDGLEPGHAIKIVKTEHFSRLTMTAISGRPRTRNERVDSEYINAVRNAFCEILDGITCNSDSTEIAPDVEKTSVSGLKYFAVTLNETLSRLQTLFRRRGIGIVFTAYYTQPDQTLTLRYGLDLASRPKRGLRTRTTSFFRVPYEWRLFPDYGQFRTAEDCPVGSGPVAWAMVLGYLDRVGHYRPSSNYSTDLYPGKVAPRLSNRRDEGLVSWITSIAERLGTNCKDGRANTLVSQMSNVEGIYTETQPDGEFKEHVSNETSAGEAAIGYIREGSPAVVRIVSSIRAFVGHYGVATRAQRRVHVFRKCFFWGVCVQWQVKSSWYLYVHRGWWGGWNAWVKASDVDYAATLTK